MATHTAVRRSKHATLVASTVDTVPFSSKPKTIEVRNLDSTAVIFFRTDGTTPTVNGDDTDRLGPGESLEVGRRQRRSSTGAAHLVSHARVLGSRGELMTFKRSTPTDLPDPSSSSKGAVTLDALDARYRAIKRQSVILFGTSLEAQNGTGSNTLDQPASNTPGAVCGRGWFNWAEHFSGLRFNLIRNAGVSGNTSAQMLARLQTDVLADDSDWVWIGGPVNDISGDVASSTTIANLTSILTAILAAGRRVVLLTCAPSTSYSTSGRKQALSDVNRWIRSLPGTTRGVVVVDAQRVLVDPATGYPATGMAADGIVHYSDAGATRVGKAVADALSTIVPPVSIPSVTIADPRCIISNPHFGTNGSGWSILDSGVTAAYAAADNTWANKVTLTLSGITTVISPGVQYVENISGGRFASGDVVQGVARFKWSNLVPLSIAAGCRPSVRIMPRKVDNSFGETAFNLATASSDVVVPVGFPSSGECVAITTKVTLPANTDRVYAAVMWTGAASGTVEVSDVSFYKVS
jgi:lysophospholipase L1-like esterase